MKSISIISFLLIIHSFLYAQSLKGIVFNSNQVPITSVNILNLSNGKHTHSNEKGEFTFPQVEIGDTLKFSHLTYQDKEFIINSLDTELKVILEEKFVSLDEIVISNELDALNLITNIDIQFNPINSSQDILRKVPGLFIAQHAGGGKAEQIFLRGFDIDHGTDIHLTVDGLPVNMVSHAHGQGYSDLHFLIPETIDKVNFGKGLYYADKGNFNTAGYVNFQTKQRLNNSILKLETGQFGTNRILGMFDLANTEKNSAYVATEYIVTDGPFDSPQNFNRINIFGKYVSRLANYDKVEVIASHFTSKWDASGQIPNRSVVDNTIGRFGAIDDTEGGQTSRSNLALKYDKFINNQTFIRNSVYFSQYDFELYSNFTFFLEDPINGDQIRQKEARNIYGFNSEFNHSFSAGSLDANWQLGVSLRNDQSNNNELSRTARRTETLSRIQLGNINESNISAYLNATFEWGKWTFNPALRLDYFEFQYNDALQANYQTQSASSTIISPKLSILYNSSKNLQLYLKGGKGFHSNDTRVVVAQNGRQILPDAYGADAGFIWKPSSKLLINLAYWYLFLEQEFVYVGDAGIVEPSGQTERQGIDLSFRYQPTNWLFMNLDANYTKARAIQEEEGNDYIPLAPDFSLVSGLNILHHSGFFGGLNFRYMRDRPANEDNSIIAEGFGVIDLNVGYSWKAIRFEVQVQNLLDTEWNEAQFATESRLQNEATSVEEIHFTPGTPLFVKGIIQFNF